MAHDIPVTDGHLPDSDRRVAWLVEAGRLVEANELFDRITGTPLPSNDQLARASVLASRAVTAWRLGRIPLALELAAEGWSDLSTSDAASAAAALTMRRLGYLLEGIGNRRSALDTLHCSVRVARQAGDPIVLAHCLQALGGVLNFRACDGPAEQAGPTFEQARAVLAEGLGLGAEPRTYRALLGAYGRSLAGVGVLAAAAEAGRQVLWLGKQHEDRWAIAVGEWVLATVGRARGELAQARECATRALANAEQVADTSLVLRFSQDLADICACLGDAAGEASALRRTVAAARKGADTLREGLGQAIEHRRLAIAAQRLAMAAQEDAARDALTGLVNRLGLERSAPAMLDAAVAEGATAWLVLVDVDWFKDVNDEAGHTAGDAALREIARLLRRECRGEDLVARWAGDEFVVLLADASGDRAVGPAVAERVRAAVAGHDWSPVLGGARRPTVSVGVACGPTCLDELFAAADLVLYQAKRQGRNRVAVYQPMRSPV